MKTSSAKETSGGLVVWIKADSVLARVAARRLKSPHVAMVLGRTIHLWGVNREEFLLFPRWVRHELEHVRQFRKYGFIRFLFLYLLEWVKRGYRNNRFEQEARGAEADLTSLADVTFH